MDKLLKTVGILGILIVSISIGFYFGIVLPFQTFTQKDIVKDCEKSVENEMKESKGSTIKDYEFKFKVCMRRHGYR